MRPPLSHPSLSCHTTSGKPAAFTLVEVVISLVIIGILIVIIFEAYITIAKISTRIELEKHVQQDVLYTTQVIQNLVDTYPIATGTNNTQIAFQDTQNASRIVTLTGNNCSLDSSDTIAVADKLRPTPPAVYTPCRIIKYKQPSGGGQSTDITYLTSPATHISSLTFTPFLNDESSDSIDKIYNNGFGLAIDIASIRYSPTNRSLNVRSQQQTFYNSRKGS